jgi:hypothetical protein
MDWFKGLFSKGSKPRTWTKCARSSNWDGSNAQRRMMNVLSPAMSEATFQSYLNWMRSRRVDHCNVLFCNNRDGEYGGYSIYGNNIDWTPDRPFVDCFKRRIKAIRKAGKGVVGWGMTDDDRDWNERIIAHFDHYVRDLKKLGLLDELSIFVICLETQETTKDPKKVAALVATVKKYFKGPVTTHETSGRADFMGVCDVGYLQESPGKSIQYLKKRCQDIAKTFKGKPFCMFEIERQPSPEKCAAMLALPEGKGRPFSVGNV